MQVSVHLVLCEAVVAAVVSCSPPMRHAMRQAAMEAVVYSDLLSACSPLLHVQKAAPSVPNNHGLECLSWTSLASRHWFVRNHLLMHSVGPWFPRLGGFWAVHACFLVHTLPETPLPAGHASSRTVAATLS